MVNEEMKIQVGQRIRAKDDWPYTGLLGNIIEILEGEEKETENEGIEYWCSLDFPLFQEDIFTVQESFSQAYGIPKILEEVGLDRVCMSLENLEFLREEDNKQIGEKIDE